MQRTVRNQIVSCLIVLEFAAICHQNKSNPFALYLQYMHIIWRLRLALSLQIWGWELWTNKRRPSPRTREKGFLLVMFHQPILLAGRQLGWNDREDSKTCTQVDLAEWPGWIIDHYGPEIMHLSDATDRCPLDASSNAMQHHEGMSRKRYTV